MKEQLLSRLPEDFPWRNQIHWFKTIDSTSNRAKAMAAEGAPHGTVLIADTQTAGRGRMGRSFASPEKTGLYLSVILRPNCSPKDLMHLTCAVGVAVCQAAEAFCGLQVALKWINDLVIGKKKLGGILTELAVDGERVDYAVVGIGINCNAVPTEVSGIATSLSEALGKPADINGFATALLDSLAKMSHALLTNTDAIMEQYRKRCITVGQQICLLQGDTVRYGTALDIDSQGGLLVSYADGTRETVNTGEVSVRGMYGYV